MSWIPAGLRGRGGSSRRGLTLLEVMLSIAIFGGAMAAIGELIRVGARSAAEARDLATAQLLCETKMAEITAGVAPPEPVGATAVDSIEAADQWVYTVEVEPIEQQGLLAVRVTVQQNVDPREMPVSFSLDRWMIDPDVLAQLSAEEAMGAEESSSGESSSGESSSGSSSSGSSGSAEGAAGGGGSSGGGAAGGGGAPGGGSGGGGRG